MEMSGLVAVLSDDLTTVISTRDLGPDPVTVKPGRVLPLVEVRPDIGEGEFYGTFVDDVGAVQVTRTWAKALPTVDEYTAAIQLHLDRWAQLRGYDNIHTAASYKDDPNSAYAAEGLSALAARSAVWTYATAELNKVLNGERPQPSIADLIAELPAMVWP